MLVLTEEEIREHSFTAIFELGERLFSEGRVSNLTSIEESIIATVRDKTTVVRSIISRNGKKLRFSCTCGSSRPGACEHAVAVMLAAVGSREVQVGLDIGDFLIQPAGSGPVSRDDKASLSDSGFSDSFIEKDKNISNVVIETLPAEKPRFRLYLTEHNGRLFIEARFAYYSGRVEFSRFDSEQSRVVAAENGFVLQIRRSRAREYELLSTLTTFDLVQYRTGFYTPSIDPRLWILHQLPLLAREGYEIYGMENLQYSQIRRSYPKLSVSVRSGKDEFYCSIDVSFDGISATLASLISSVRRQSCFVLLNDGSSGMIPQQWLEKLAAVFSHVNKKTESNVLRLDKSQMGLAEILREASDDFSCDEEFEIKRRCMREFRGVKKQSAPEGFKVELRPYQQAGLEWFCFLKDYGFGGCLGDDMGLGKTVQTLALLLKEKQTGGGQPSLVIVPNTLIFNWQRESNRFSPSLNLLTYHGTNRYAYREILRMADVVLTTYGTVVRDIEILGKISFHYVILDEAHLIKNPFASMSKAVRLLKCNHRLALTGTPIENNLSELWSLFSFLNPGMFGRFGDFKKHFIIPIEKEKNETSLQVLRRMVFPFILRRTKQQVVKELPPKNEIIVYTEMLQPQRMLYEVSKQLFYGKIKDTFERAGMEESRIQILEGLLRLRQICCHPFLYDNTYKEDSGKFQLVEQMLRDAVSEGHKVLLFSQFVAALNMLRERCLGLGIRNEILTGETHDRQGAVDRFQKGEEPTVFLISLKAGGTGLNLTAADYVFHLDPWWNPSIENQASDRAHRIGQSKPVFVYKMITRDSIEERVLELQEKKRRLTDSIIQSDASFFKNLNREDLEFLFERGEVK